MAKSNERLTAHDAAWGVCLLILGSVIVIGCPVVLAMLLITR